MIPPLVILKRLHVRRLTNHEYLTFMLGVKTLIETTTTDAFCRLAPTGKSIKHRIDEMFALFTHSVQSLECIMAMMLAGEETALLVELDARRVGIFRSIHRWENICRKWMKPPFEYMVDHNAHLRDAGKNVWRMHKHYIKIRNTPHARKTKRFEEYIYNMTEKVLEPHIATLHLGKKLAELQQANIEYKRAEQICSNKHIEKMFDDCVSLRTKTDQCYDDLYQILRASVILYPNPETIAFVETTNKLVAEKKAATKQLASDYLDRKINNRALALGPKLPASGGKQ